MRFKSDGRLWAIIAKCRDDGRVDVQTNEVPQRPGWESGVICSAWPSAYVEKVEND